MALLNNAQPQQPPQQAGPAPQQMSQGFPPEKQQLFERSFQVGKNIIYEKQIFGGIVEQIDGGDAADGLAEAIVLVLRTIEKDKSVGQLPADVAFATGIALLADLADALTETGRGPFDEATIEKALSMGVQLWLQLNGARIDPRELQAQMQQLQSYGGAQ